MTSREIQNDLADSTTPLIPRWLRIPAAVKYSGLCRSHLYDLIARQKLRSICLKSHKHNTRGVRLIDRESIDQLMLEGLTKDE
jgi:predicted DNA-binding transcriptional regulator AlpA